MASSIPDSGVVAVSFVLGFGVSLTCSGDGALVSRSSGDGVLASKSSSSPSCSKSIKGCEVVEWGVSTRWLKLGKFMFLVLSRSVLSVPVKINSQLIFLIFKVFVIFANFEGVFGKVFVNSTMVFRSPNIAKCIF
jgi:hypothetical protein